MNAVIYYHEISNYIENKVKIRPNFICVDNKTLEISYKPGILPSIILNLHVESINKDVVCITYNCNTAASLMIAGVVKYLEEKIPSSVEINPKDKCIQVNLNQINKADKILEHISNFDLSFEKEHLIVELSFI